MLAQVGLTAGARRPLSARVLRRPAPAHRHRPRADPQSEARDLRRAGVRARRLHPRADHQPAARAEGRSRSLLHHDQPRSGRGRAHQRPRGGHVSRPDRRDRRLARDLRGAAPSLYARADRGDPRSVCAGGRVGDKIKGEIPNPFNPPTGCAFHPRCPIAVDKGCALFRAPNSAGSPTRTTSFAGGRPERSGRRPWKGPLLARADGCMRTQSGLPCRSSRRPALSSRTVRTNRTTGGHLMPRARPHAHRRRGACRRPRRRPRRSLRSPPLQAIRPAVSAVHGDGAVLVPGEAGREAGRRAEGAVDHAVERDRHDGGDPLRADGLHRARRADARDDVGQDRRHAERDPRGLGGAVDALRAGHALGEHQVDPRFHRQGPHRASRREAHRPRDRAADGGGEGVRARAIRQARPDHGVAVASGRDRSAARRQVGDHRAFRKLAVLLHRTGGARHPQGAAFLRRRGRAPHQRRADDDEEIL